MADYIVGGEMGNGRRKTSAIPDSDKIRGSGNVDGRRQDGSMPCLAANCNVSPVGLGWLAHVEKGKK